MWSSDYRQLLAQRRVQWILAAWLLTGLTTGVPFALVLLLRQDHSYATAGAVVAVTAIARALSGPFRGRQIDRRGIRVIVPQALFSTGVFCVVAATATAVPGWALALLAGVGAAAAPPVFSSLRSLWPRLVSADHLIAAGYAIQSVASEIVFVTVPLVVAGLATALSPPAALYVIVASGLVGAVAFALAPVSRSFNSRTGVRPTALLGLPKMSGMRVLLAANLPLGMVFGVLDVALPAFAGEHGKAADAGFAFAALAAGSFVGGIAYGTRRWATSAGRRLMLLVGGFAIVLAVLPAADSTPAVVAIMAGAGVCVAPFVATTFTLVDVVATSSAATEAWTWITGADALGMGAGSWLGGTVASDHGAATALVLPAVCAAIALLALYVGRRALSGGPALLRPG